MRKKKPTKSTVTKKLRRVPILVLLIVAAASLAVGAATVIGRHRGEAPTVLSTSKTTNTANRADKKYLTVKVAGNDVQVDPQTGQIKPLSADEAKQLADGLKTMINKSTDGLVQEQHPDGTVSMDLQGRFQNVTVARRNADGSLSQSCVDNPEAAASFFGIDPQLLGAKPRVGVTSQPIHPPTAKASAQ